LLRVHCLDSWGLGVDSFIMVDEPNRILFKLVGNALQLNMNLHDFSAQ